MTTKRLRESNRANARKSTGPRTPAGKARSSRNATTHGLYALDPVCQFLGETADDYQAHLERYTRFFRDALATGNPLVADAIETLHSSHWRLQRAANIEAGFFDLACENIYDRNVASSPERLSSDFPGDDPDRAARRLLATAFHICCSENNMFPSLVRAESQHRRAYESALKTLLALIAKPLPPSSTVEPEPGGAGQPPEESAPSAVRNEPDFEITELESAE